MIGNRDIISCSEEFLVVEEGQEFTVISPFPLMSAILLQCSHNTVITVKMTTSIMRAWRSRTVGKYYSAWRPHEYK